MRDLVNFDATVDEVNLNAVTYQRYTDWKLTITAKWIVQLFE